MVEHDGEGSCGCRTSRSPTFPRDVACVINTHLHYDHCGGNRLFPGVPIHVQARELADA